MHSPYLRHLRQIADRSYQVSVMKQIFSFCVQPTYVYTTVSPVEEVYTLQVFFCLSYSISFIYEVLTLKLASWLPEKL